MTWESVQPQLRRDPRFVNSPLSHNQQVHLFHAHVNGLRTKQLAGLHALFESHTPALNSSFTALPVASLMTSVPINKLGYDIDQVEREFEKWQRERTHEARLAFNQMLNENSFVEFWGRLGKIGGKGVDASIKYDDIGDDGDEEQVDMKALAKTVDLKEIVKVLKVGCPEHWFWLPWLTSFPVRTTNGTLYSTISPNSESSGCGCVKSHHFWRDGSLIEKQDYLANLSAPTLSVHVSEK